MSNSKSKYKIIVCLETSQFWFVGDLNFHIKLSNCLVECYYNGSKYWYKNGELHREKGPAIEYSNGFKCWYQNGKLHRKDGPASEFSNGSKEWRLNGLLHREDGPAIENSNGSKEWYLNGEELSEKKFKKFKYKKQKT